jgi:hypothetical protein
MMGAVAAMADVADELEKAATQALDAAGQAAERM